MLRCGKCKWAAFYLKHNESIQSHSRYSRSSGFGTYCRRSFVSWLLWLIPPVIIGLLWILVAVFPIGLCALTVANVLGIWRMALFFHFLDVVWIFIFTIAYVMGYLAEGCAGQYTDYSRGRVCPLFAADALGSI